MNTGHGVCGVEGYYKVPKYCNGHIAQAGLALPEYAARIVLAAGSTSRPKIIIAPNEQPARLLPMPPLVDDRPQRSGS